MTAVGQKAYGGGTGLNVIEERLAVQDVIVLDGAFATELEARGE